ncbi:Putative mcm domain-containing protein [Gryllus bimaculatus]|nr:Putative mcm domain-containing protein [Gryllus bimaculatus]
MILYYFQTSNFIRTHIDLITMFPFSWINEFQTSERDTISESTGCLLSQANKTIHEKILYFLNLTGSLSKVEEAFIKYDNNLKNFPEQKSLFPSLRVPLEIDLKEIQEISGDYILKLLINEPQMTSSIVQRVIYTYIVSKLSLEDFQQQQLEIPLKIKSLSDLTVCSISNIHVGKLTLLRGTLLSISTPTKFIYGLKCSLTSCNSKGQRVIGAPPQRISLCSLCGNSLQEVPEACEMGEQTSGFLVVLPEYQNLHNTAFNKQAILLCFKDETMRGLEPGLEYEIAGQMTLKSFQVWAVQRKCHINQEIDFHSIPSSIRKLQQDIEILCPDSPWTFVGSLASALSANDSSETCFFNLKMGLLLSLASQLKKHYEII